MLLPLERQQKIKQLIKEKRNLKIGELSDILNVSEMTIHRDLKPLVDEGIIMKTFGGITLVREEPGKITDVDDCVLCNRKINNRFTYKLILKNKKIENTCCPHCGLIRQQQLKDEVIQSLCYDFFTGTTISSNYTWFVFDADVKLGCCIPQIIPFENKEHAEGFSKGFGGTVLTFSEVTEKTNAIMTNFNQQSCCSNEKIEKD